MKSYVMWGILGGILQIAATAHEVTIRGGYYIGGEMLIMPAVLLTVAIVKEMAGELSYYWHMNDDEK